MVQEKRPVKTLQSTSIPVIAGMKPDEMLTFDHTTPKTIKDVEDWVKEVLPTAVAMNQFALSMTRDRDSATIMSATGCVIEHLLRTLDGISKRYGRATKDENGGSSPLFRKR